MTKIMATLREDLCAFITLYRWIFRRMRNVSDKLYKENQNTFHVQ